MARRFEVLATRAELEARVADECVSGILAAIAERDRADVIVTGGTVGIGTLAAVRHASRVDEIDWSRVHIWWGDERFVPEGHADRNDQQARVALLDHIAIPDHNLHPFPSDHGQSLTHARDDFLAQYRDGFPAFDIALNGIGPDGHAASLFPERDHGDSELVIAVDNSPKPPPERLSFTFRVLNSARRVWIVASGADKADAVGRIAQNAPEEETPAAALKGKIETVVWLDSDAAAAIRP
jgi:6-phosphogluconolactonase